MDVTVFNMEQPRGFAKSHAEHELFRRHCRDISRSAGQLEMMLSGKPARPEASQSWTQDESDTIDAWSELERSIEYVPVPEDLDELGHQQLSQFYRLSHIFHVALPFSEAERIWFLDAYRGEHEPI